MHAQVILYGNISSLSGNKRAEHGAHDQCKMHKVRARSEKAKSGDHRAHAQTSYRLDMRKERNVRCFY